MKIKVYGEIKEISSLDEEIMFYTCGPKNPTPMEMEMLEEERCGMLLVSWGFKGTVRDALKEYPEVVTLIEE